MDPDPDPEAASTASSSSRTSSLSAAAAAVMGAEEDRLVDYVVVAGYDHGKGDGGAKRRRDGDGFHCQGKVLQRFPRHDWKDTPFIEGLEHFCQPGGWVLRAERESPKFFVAVLTDINGSRHYCAVLSFAEAVEGDADDRSETDSREAADEEMEDDQSQETFLSLRSRSSSMPRHHMTTVPGVSLSTVATDGGSSLLFAPKCLVLVSRHDLPDAHRNCLRLLYTAYSECLVSAGGERVRLEHLVGNLLGSVFVPPPGGPQLRFSLGANDRLSLQPPANKSVPRTGDSVALLFRQLGVAHVLTLFAACMTEMKVLVYSRSYARLSSACTALAALMYPMRYSHVFIPVLPSSLLEVLATPTPFVIGVSSAHEREVADLLDVVKVDLDGGAIQVPENMTVPSLPPHLHQRVSRELAMVLHPELLTADDAFPSTPPSSSSSLQVLDKELRSVMLRLTVALLAGYRECLTVVRIHPRPYISLHKAAFLGLRTDLASESGFARRLLDCMFFNSFVSDRGPPWRAIDVFDDAYACAAEQLAAEASNPNAVLRHIRSLAEELYRNENPVSKSGSSQNAPPQRMPEPAEGAMDRVHQPVFPTLDEELVERVIQAGLDRFRMEKANASPTSATVKRLVPMGQSLRSNGASNTLSIYGLSAPMATALVSARRLGVLRGCVACIFENKISEAKKTFPAVLSALKARQAKLALCRELEMHKGSHTQVLLEHQQFDMVVRLMNTALQDDSDLDEHGVALALLPLSAVFGRKLAKGVIQFAYTVIQDHAVWQNLQFWEASFYTNVQKGISNLYVNLRDQSANNNNASPSSSNQQQIRKKSSSSVSSATSGRELTSYQPTAKSTKAVLELAAREARSWEGLDGQARADRLKAEEQTVYSEVFDYINFMIYLLCPLDMAASSAGARRGRRGVGDDYEAAASNSVSNSMAESDSIDAESGFEDQDVPDAGQQVVKQVLRFADKVSAESGVTEDHVRQISNMVPSSVALHLEALEAVLAQANRLPPIQKPKINFPSLLPGEELAVPAGLRVYLLADGRREESSMASGVALLPAEGALFLTNYRLIFKGSPVDPLASEHTVTRFFPVSSLTKEKRFTVSHYLAEVEQHLKEGIQLRSNTFQLIKAAFDEEVKAEEVDAFKRAVQRVQHPEHLFQHFAFRDEAGTAAMLMQQSGMKLHDSKSDKYKTIRGFASKTLKNVGRVTGYQPKKRKPSSKYLFPNVMPTQGRLSIAELTSNSGRIREEDESSDISDVIHHPTLPSTPAGGVSTSKTLERLADRVYLHDWKRQGVIPQDYVLTASGKSNNHYQGGAGSGEAFRVTTFNCRYAAVPTYPALLLVPARISDDSLRRYARHHRHGRFPTVTWRHPRSHALLLRGGGFHQRGVMGMIRRHQYQESSAAAGAGSGSGGNSQSQSGGGGGQADVPSSIDAEMYTAAIVQITPRSTLKPDSAWKMSGSELSINSLVAASGAAGTSGSASGEYSSVHSHPTLTPSSGRKFNPLAKAVGTLTRTTGAPSSSSATSPGSASAQGKLSRLSLQAGKTGKLYGSQTSLTSSSTAAGGSYVRGGSARYSDAGADVSGFLNRTSLYVFSDRGGGGSGSGRGLGPRSLESHPKTELIPLELPEPRRLRASFKKLMRACVPSSQPAQPDHTFLRQVEASEWLVLLHSVMQAAGAVVDLMDIQHASVSLCLEDGWDANCTVSSLAQLCLDPYYRTMEGFRVLVEKEWLSVGHRFHHRGNLASPGQSDAAFTPVFLQFLDAVHQIHAQFPISFEFNQFYIRFLAYHHVSCRFRTFLLDCERQRHEVGLLSTFATAVERSGNNSNGSSFPRQGSTGNDSYSSDDEFPQNSNSHKTAASRKSSSIGSTSCGANIFDYVDAHAAKSPIFHNFAYAPPDLADSEDVLRPFSNVSDLRIWDYFTSEQLRHGAAYDLELRGLDIKEEEEEEMSGLSGWNRERSGKRRTLSAGYDSLHLSSTDHFSRAVSEVNKAESDLGRGPHHWRMHWLAAQEEALARLAAREEIADGVEDVCPVVQTTPSVAARRHGRLMHKRNTMEVILRGRAGAGVSASSASAANQDASSARKSQQHRFERCNYSTPTYCDVSGSLLWGPVRTGLKCADCGLNVHDKSAEAAGSVACTRYSRSGGSGANLPRDATEENLNQANLSGSEARRSGRQDGRGEVMDSDDGEGENLFHRFGSPSHSAIDDQSQIICQGYLHKQANFRIKGWKQRWFVLDATKHQLRYYDTREDFHCRGHVDLSEVTRVAAETGLAPVAAGTPGAPRKADDGCFFELHTLKRTYCFCAEGRQAALEWVHKIQSCLST